MKNRFFIMDKNDKRNLGTLELIALEADARLREIKLLYDTLRHILVIYENTEGKTAEEMIKKIVKNEIKTLEK